MGPPVNEVLRESSLRIGEELSFWSKLKRRGKVWREGVLDVGVEMALEDEEGHSA